MPKPNALLIGVTVAVTVLSTGLANPAPQFNVENIVLGKPFALSQARTGLFKQGQLQIQFTEYAQNGSISVRVTKAAQAQRFSFSSKKPAQSVVALGYRLTFVKLELRKPAPCSPREWVTLILEKQ